MSFNILIDEMPEAVLVQGKSYFINSGYRTIIAILLLLEDPLFSKKEKIQHALSLFYSQEIPNDLIEAYQAMMDFISCYRNYEVKKQRGERAFDYEADAARIFSAFFQVYHMDLTRTQLHWFKFLALFENLNDGTPQIVQIMQYRLMEISSSMSKEQQAFYRKMKREYSLQPNNESTHQNNLASAFLMEK